MLDQTRIKLISGSSAFSKSTLNMRKFTVNILLKPGLENFEHFFTSVWDECNCAVVWAFFGIAFLWDWNETDLFQSCGHCWVFQICQHIECSTFTASSFRIWNSSTGIPSPPSTSFSFILSFIPCQLQSSKLLSCLFQSHFCLSAIKPASLNQRELSLRVTDHFGKTAIYYTYVVFYYNNSPSLNISCKRISSSFLLQPLFL